MITEEDDKESKFCFLCQIPCSNVCPHCRLVHYCNEEHFNLHRVNLKEEKVKKRDLSQSMGQSRVRSMCCLLHHSSEKGK